MKRYRYPEKAIDTFTAIEKRLDAEPDFAAAFDPLVDAYGKTDCPDRRGVLDKTEELARSRGINEYSMLFVLLMNASRELLENYRAAGLDEAVFWDTMDDLRCKLLECLACKEVAGTFVAGWFGGFYDMRMFKYGRFEFHLTDYGFDIPFTTKCGVHLKNGDVMVNMHIPSTGVPLTDDVRLDSYRRAYKAFKQYFPDKPFVFCCSSWLLYPEHRQFLPEKSNILRFMSDFEIVSWEEGDHFGDAWRIFGKYAELPPEQLPTDTSLRRAYADRLASGKPTGNGFGVFVFDGENIVR